MDIVFIKDLRIETVIGIYEWERKVQQTISLNIDMGWNIRQAANHDNIEFALNYKSVAKKLKLFVAGTEFLLVEKLAEEICKIIVTEFNVPWVKLELHKLGAVSGSHSVGVTIERTVADYAMTI